LWRSWSIFCFSTEFKRNFSEFADIWVSQIRKMNKFHV
jgi:hypothetical protein